MLIGRRGGFRCEGDDSVRTKEDAGANFKDETAAKEHRKVMVGIRNEQRRGDRLEEMLKEGGRE